MENKKEIIANLIFPDVTLTITDLEKKFPPRKLKNGAQVTRFAPSPTGFLHTGSLFTSLISWKIARQSRGIFYGRLEDTDTKREIAGSGDELIRQLKTFEIDFDESFVGKGKYGPYIQSERKWIYDIVLKEFLRRDLAYPCFMTQEELNALRQEQEKNKINPGYYGEYARDRFLSDDDVIANLKNNKPYVLRFKSLGNPEEKVIVDDLVKGHLELPENNLDIVIMKEDGLPTYHFAHLVDDHFMRTTVITRGEEWLSSLPIHLQLFDAISFPRVKYAHLPVIMKIDDETKQRRKLSKRKDPEASVAYFLEKGYEITPFLQYLMTIVNSNYEEWLIKHTKANMFDFTVTFDKMNNDGALFDIEKVNYFSREYLGSLTGKEFTKRALKWAEKHDATLASFIKSDPNYFTKIISIERGGDKPRKDYASFSEIMPLIGFMDDNVYNNKLATKLLFDRTLAKDKVKEILLCYAENHFLDVKDEQTWFGHLKELATKLGFATNKKEFKANPTQYAGMINQLAEVLRIAICGKASTPNFFMIQKILTPAKVVARIKQALSILNN